MKEFSNSLVTIVIALSICSARAQNTSRLAMHDLCNLRADFKHYLENKPGVIEISKEKNRAFSWMALAMADVEKEGFGVRFQIVDHFPRIALEGTPGDKMNPPRFVVQISSQHEFTRAYFGAYRDISLAFHWARDLREDKIDGALTKEHFLEKFSDYYKAATSDVMVQISDGLRAWVTYQGLRESVNKWVAVEEARLDVDPYKMDSAVQDSAFLFYEDLLVYIGKHSERQNN